MNERPIYMTLCHEDLSRRMIYMVVLDAAYATISTVAYSVEHVIKCIIVCFAKNLPSVSDVSVLKINNFIYSIKNILKRDGMN